MLPDHVRTEGRRSKRWVTYQDWQLGPMRISEKYGVIVAGRREGSPAQYLGRRIQSKQAGCTRYWWNWESEGQGSFQYVNKHLSWHFVPGLNPNISQEHQKPFSVEPSFQTHFILHYNIDHMVSHTGQHGPGCKISFSYSFFFFKIY